jgi:glycerol-3-phosphate dehydrogenase
MIYISESNLITIAGGKWTTYRAMAKETVDKAIEVLGKRDIHICDCVYFILFYFMTKLYFHVL